MIVKNFGKTKLNEDVLLFTLNNSNGMAVNILNYGATIQSIILPDKNGTLTDVCLGYDSIAEYESQDACLGASIGRHANRIGKGVFSLNGEDYHLAINNGPNHLHGGLKGFDKYVWDCEEEEEEEEEKEKENNKLVLSHFSEDKTEGYPGNLYVKLTVTLDKTNALILDYIAVSDKDTLVNLTNHTYFNLSGHDSGKITDQTLQIFADEFTENDENCLPTGKILSVANTPFDFRTPKAIGHDISEDNIQLKNGSGYDHNYVLKNNNKLEKAAIAFSNQSGIRMTAFTNMPGVQFYTANFLSKRAGKGGAIYNPRDGFCLETQFFPNSMACENFPSCVLKAEEIYQHTLIYEFSK